jgi:hypothetical protein
MAKGGREVSLIVWTDRTSCSSGDAVKVNAALQNDRDQTMYVDRRIAWIGLGGGLQLEIRNEQGKALPARILSDHPLPPPPEDDTSILIRLEPGFFYGT